jgi:hypothetical protein
VCATAQCQVLEVGAEGVADRGLYEVGAFVRIFRNRVISFDDEGIVARAADQRVRAKPAGQGIVAGIAVQEFRAGSTIYLVVAGQGEGQKVVCGCKVRIGVDRYAAQLNSLRCV